ncbi:MAG: response regulator [Oxalobacter sp.]
MKENSNILIVEDEPAIAELIAFTIKTAGFTPIVASRGNQALTILQRTNPDMVLLDWMLPDLSGISVLEKIRANPEIREMPVIMLTAKAHEQDKVSALDGGADDYITKPFSPKELVARIKALLRRKDPEKSKSRFVIGPVQLDTASCQLTVDGKLTEIGKSEYLLLRFFMTNPDRVFSRVQLLDSVWHDALNIEERTIDVHILRLRKILNDKGKMIKTVRGLGYMFSTKENMQ